MSQKSAAATIVAESAKVDLSEWLSGGRIRTQSVWISRDPKLAAEADQLAGQMNMIHQRLGDLDDAGSATSGSLSDDDESGDLRARWEELHARWEQLSDEYQGSLMEFVFRSQWPGDAAAVTEHLGQLKVKEDGEAKGMALVALTCVSPGLTYTSLRELLDTLGNDVFLAMSEAVNSLARPRRDRQAMTAPLSLRP